MNDFFTAQHFLLNQLQTDPVLSLAYAVSLFDPLWNHSDDINTPEHETDTLYIALHVLRRGFPILYFETLQALQSGKSYSEIENLICHTIQARGIPLEHLEWIGYGIPLPAYGVDWDDPELLNAYPEASNLLACFGVTEDQAISDEVYTTARRVGEELTQEREGNTVSDLANMITDASLGLCGHASYEKACHTLALFCRWHNLSPTTIDVIYRYLLVFQQAPDTRADDFEALAKTLYHLQALRSVLQTALTHANGLHSWQGRTSYHLLGSADQLLQGAKALLQRSGASYTQEKLMNGMSQISYALNEASQHDSSYNCLLKPQK